jgi:predicted metalloendopeptidase
MNPKTRIKAAAKVRNINFGVLYMTQSYNYKTPQLCDNIIMNMQILGKAYVDRAIQIVRDKYSTDLWDEVPVYNVNAYYMSSGNRLFIPAAIANWPFYCSDASIGWNYGALGSVIGHEITHAFDDTGRDFDQYGNRSHWWTEGDTTAYETKTRDIIALYNKSSLYSRNVNGKQTLSENIADLGGVAISLAALKVQLEKQGVTDAERLQIYRDFFQGYATSWREKERKAHCIRELIVDVHSPAIFRVNNIVPHFQEFYDAFAICVSDPMYIPPEKRLRIF